MECVHCKKTIKKFTVSKDWSNRKYHKKCYKQLQEIEAVKRMVIKLSKSN
jgi:hypothetical protein